MNIIVIINLILNTIIMYFFLNLLLKRNKKSVYFMIIYLFLFLLIKIITINFSLSIKFTINTVISLIYLYLFYENRIVTKIISYCIYSYLEMSIYIFLIIINFNSLKSNNFTLSFNGIYYCNPKYILIEKIILLIILMIITYNKNKNIRFSRKYSFSIISIVSILMLVLISIMFFCMLKNGYYKTKPRIMLSLLVILITLIIIMTYLLKLLFIIKKESNNDFIEDNSMVNSNNSLVDDKHIKYVLHDIKNHIQNINVLIENKKYSEATKYSNEMYNLVNGIEMTIKTGNVLLDTIINNKIYLAKKEGINVTFNIKVPNKLNININNLSAILDNILDNAIEANNRINNNKFIDINLKYNLGYLFIKVTNSYNGLIKYDVHSKKIISSKQNKNKHGIGLENIKKVVELYSGEIKIDYDASQFSITILLNL